MKIQEQRKRFYMAVVLVVTALAGTWAVGANPENHEVKKMTEKVQTVCVGRMLIDLPEEAHVVLGRGFIQGFDINSFNETDAEFRERLATREAQLRAKPDRLGGNKNLETVRDLKTNTGLVGKLFIHGRQITEGTAANGPSELEHFRHENVALEAMVHANGISIDLSTERYDPARAGNLSKLVDQLVVNPANRIPTEPGFCIDKAYFRDPLNLAGRVEQFFMSAQLPGHPDMTIGLSSMAGGKPEKLGLIARSEQAWTSSPLAQDIKERVTRLRGASRKIGDLTGDELAIRVREKNSTITFNFEWEMRGTRENVLQPNLSLEMETGHSSDGPVPSSMSQAAALALWDKISSSIRLRPTAPLKISAAEPPTPPIGTLAAAGDTCPQSGWWLSSDGGDGIGVLGGQRQYLMQGQRMPQALLLPPQTLWEKVRGVQPSFEANAPTSWKLVDRRTQKRFAPNVTLAQAVVAQAAMTSAGVSAIEPQASVGTYATTGKACPASGWWRSEESNALDGTRWFAAGSVLPAATFAVPPGAFGKAATGTQNTMQRRGNWMLVRLAQTPEPGGDAAEARGPTNDQTGPGSPEGSAA